MSKNLNVLVTHIEFTARPVGEWVNNDLRTEVTRRLESKFHRHKLQDLHFESGCVDEIRGRVQLAPAIDVPFDAKSDLHPGTVEWALSGLKKGRDARKNWWSQGAYAFLLDSPAELEFRQEHDGLKVPAELPKQLALISSWPVPLFVSPQKEVTILSWDFLVSDINTNQWRLLPQVADEAFRENGEQIEDGSDDEDKK